MSPVSWGIRFEPVVKQILEHTFHCKIFEPGRITHPDKPRLAASADGIFEESEDPNQVGRLVEIKCPYTRAIGGEIPIDYWIQMQIQMEVCDLDECDFIETKFTEYETEHEYFNDTSEIVRGIIIVFIKDNDFFYKYMPFSLHGESDELGRYVFAVGGVGGVR
jgi:hypothetical protein